MDIVCNFFKKFLICEIEFYINYYEFLKIEIISVNYFSLLKNSVIFIDKMLGYLFYFRNLSVNVVIVIGKLREIY